MSYTVRFLTILLGVLMTATLTFASATTSDNPFGDKDIALGVDLIFTMVSTSYRHTAVGM